MTPGTSTLDRRLFRLQRLSAMALAVCLVVHLVTMILAVQGGLTAAEILERTRDNSVWLSFYLAFVLMVTLHVPIGLRNILREFTGWSASTVNLAGLLAGFVLLALGLRAAWAVFLA
ncbi:MAG: succinate dehydrogenase [Burkholderiaceae bacterium]